jgi:hypothetical protein
MLITDSAIVDRTFVHSTRSRKGRRSAQPNASCGRGPVEGTGKARPERHRGAKPASARVRCSLSAIIGSALALTVSAAGAAEDNALADADRSRRHRPRVGPRR